MKRESGLTGKRNIILTVSVLGLVMILTWLVRLPGFFGGGGSSIREPFIDKEGLSYLNQMDGYYHLRMADEIALKGHFGTEDEVTGERMDFLRFAPEGRSASYHAGIIYISVGIWKILRAFSGVTLHEVAFYLSCFFSSLTALAAFLLARKISSSVGGLFAAVFVACAPAFVERTAAGSFDTDMTQLLFTILLMLLMMETLKAGSHRQAVLTAVCTAVTAAGFTLFWSSSSLLFVGIMMAGGAAGLIALALGKIRKNPDPARTFFREPAFFGYVMTGTTTLLLLLLLHGPSYLGSFFRKSSVLSIERTILPGILQSVSELQRLPFAPAAFADWFKGYVPGSATVINGIGGLCVLVLDLAGLALLVVRAVHAASGQDKTKNMIHFTMMTVWFLACLYGLKLGRRFIEHFAAPAGILAGSAAGMLIMRPAEDLFRNRTDERRQSGSSRQRRKPAAMAACLAVVSGLCLFAGYETVKGSIMECRHITPLATDASENAMEWIRQNAESEKTVIASWWDMGYYYEYESGFPVLWDGGSQDAVRAIVIGKALTSSNMQQSRALLHMLAEAGNRPVFELAGELGAQKGFEALWETASLDKEKTIDLLTDTYGMDPDRARTIEALVHPIQTGEVFLVLSGALIMRLGLIEYYADWDFTGTQPMPVSTAFFLYPDGSGSLREDREEDQDFLEHRESETIWRLYLDRNGTDSAGGWFEKDFEEADGHEMVQVWRVM